MGDTGNGNVQVPGDAVLVRHKEQVVPLDVSAAVSVDDVHATILSVFRLNKAARIVLKRASDGAVVVPGPRLAPGEYTVEVVDGGSGDTKRRAALAFIGAPLLLLYYRLILPRIWGDE